MKQNLKFLSSLIILSVLSYLKGFSQITIASGSYIVKMDAVTSGYTALKPYGMIHELVKFYHVPVKWIVKDNKAKDEIDFTIEGINYSAGIFVIESNYITPDIMAVITAWKATATTTSSNGYKRGQVTANMISSAYTFSGANIMQINAVPYWTLNDDNTSISRDFILNAGIPASQYNIVIPSLLDACNDIYVMPHADPTWAVHSNLLFWNNTAKGAIWAGCHAVSVLENVYNPANTTQQMNFLSEIVPSASLGNNSLMHYSSNPNHKDGSPPYGTNKPIPSGMSGGYTPADDWVSQYIGSSDAAHTNGSEQIYLPKTGGGWRSTTNIICFDSTQQDIPVRSAGVAAVIAYGRAFGDSNRGWVMYEGGHDINGTSAANIAALKAFHNWSLLATQDKAVQVGAITGITSNGTVAAGSSLPLSVMATSPVGAQPLIYNWRAVRVSDGASVGSFSANNTSAANNTSFTIPATVLPIVVNFVVTVTDPCGRQSFSITTNITLQKTVYNPDINAGNVNKVIPGNVATNDELVPAGSTYNTPVLSGAPSGSLPVITMNADGTYTFQSNMPGIYTYYVPVCLANLCTDVPLVITVKDPFTTTNVPVANTDLTSTPVNTPVTYPVLSNDAATNTGTTLGIPAITHAPGHGTAVVNADGTITYTPGAGFSGVDTLTYQICEAPGGTLCASAREIITVLPAGVANTTAAADDYTHTLDHTPVGGNVMTNDKDPEGNTIAITKLDLNGDGILETTPVAGVSYAVTNGGNTVGNLTINPATGAYVFTPVAGFGGTVNIPYQITDNGTPGATDQATLHIVVTKNEAPVADPKSFLVEASAFGNTPPASFPEIAGYKSILASSSALSGYPAGGALSGSDAEDCPGDGSCNTGATFNITAINSNTKLYYDFGAGAIEITVTGSPFTIPNFDPAKLVIYGQAGGGTAAAPVGFSYSMTDSKGLASTPVGYTILTATALPVTILNFSAGIEGNVIVLNWNTAREQDNSGFSVEKSNDAKSWSAIGFVKSKAEKGNSTVMLTYDHIDNIPLSGNNFYRLKQVDINGAYAYSPVVNIWVEHKSHLNIYPNPVSDYVTIEGLQGNETINIYNLSGDLMQQVKAGSSSVKISLVSLIAGIYQVRIIGSGDTVTNYKILKIK